MLQEEVLDSPVVVDFTDVSQNLAAQENPVLIDQLSQPLVGQWNKLVSQTNWEKGDLILHWRSELMAAGQPNTVYSDESWARRVGNVTAQHVGRLRRVAERFGKTYQNFSSLYWSHFFVALEWDDADLWLEGAVQNDWSVAQMQVQRWDALGIADKHKPHDSNIIVTEWDDDTFSRQSESEPLPHDRIEGRITEIGSVDAVEGFDASSISSPDSLSEDSPKKEPKKSKAKQPDAEGNLLSTKELLMRLEGVSTFPVDLAEPIELLKIAILNHQLAGWKAVSAEQVCQTLDVLKKLTTAQ